MKEDKKNWRTKKGASTTTRKSKVVNQFDDFDHDFEDDFDDDFDYEFVEDIEEDMEEYTDEEFDESFNEGPKLRDVIKQLLTKKARKKGNAPKEHEKEQQEKKNPAIQLFKKIGGFASRIWRYVNWLIIGIAAYTLINDVFNNLDRIVSAVVGTDFSTLTSRFWPIESALKIILIIFCIMMAVVVSEDTGRDKLRLNSGMLVAIIPAAIRFVAGRGVGSITFAGIMIISLYAEKIFTDKFAHRVSPKKTNIDPKDDGGWLISQS